MYSDARTDGVKESRHDVHLNPALVERTGELERALIGIVRERDDHALDVEELDELVDLLATAEQDDVLEVVAALLRFIVDEPDEVQRVFRVLEDLSCNELPDIARAK